MLKLHRALSVWLALGAIACASDPAGPSNANAAGASGSPSGTAGASAGSAGASAAGSSPGGSAGQSTEPTSGAGGALGGTGAGGGAGAGGSAGTPGAEPAWTCPAGPFPAPAVGEIETLCPGFDFQFNYLEGPTWSKAENALYFSNFDIGKGLHGDIIKYTLGGECQVFTTEVGCNGLAVGIAGKLLGACQQSRAVQSFDLASKAPLTLASMFMDKMLDSPNDLVVHTNGSIYFTNRTAELDGRPVGYGSAVFWIDPQGTLNLIEKGDGNGIALSPDQRTLYTNNLATWPLDENGVPGAKAPKLVDGDGLAVDCAGNLYQSGGQIKNAQGQGIGNFPGGTNMAFGGPDGKLLFVVSGGSNVRALHMNVPGIP